MAQGKSVRVVVLAERLGTSAGGTEVYERNLLNAMHLQSLDTGDIEIIPLLARERAMDFLTPSLKPHCQFLFPRGKLGTALTSGFSIRHLNPDVLHCCFVVPPFIGSAPVVTTIHDLGFVYHKEHYPRLLTAKLITAVHHAVHKSSRLITVSNSTKVDLLAATKAKTEQIVTVYNGLDEQFVPNLCADGDQQATLIRYGIRSPYILYAGKLEPRKNVGMLIEAYDQLRANKQFNGQLVLLGSPKTFMWEEAQKRIDLSPFRQDIIQTGFVANEAVPLIYAGAKVLAFITLYEGFGFPVLEAMASAVPVVCSNTTCLPEIADEGAILVDPHNKEQIVQALDTALNNETVRSQLIKKGVQRAKSFTWQKAASQMLAIYRDVAATHRKKQTN